MKRKPEIRIRLVSPDLITELYNIAKYKDLTLSTFLKPHLRDIANKYPEEMKRNPNV
jgi:hypothetical protein